MTGPTRTDADMAANAASLDEAAAAWLVRLQGSPDEDAVAAFEAWRAADPA